MPTRRAFAQAFACSAALILLAASPAFADWDKARLDAGIKSIEQAAKGRLGVALLDLRDRKSWSHRGAEPFPMQSVFKLPLAVAVLQAVEAGKLKLDQKITLTRNDLSLYHSPLAKSFKGERNDYTLRDLLTRSTGESDNTAADLLLRLIGGPQVLTAMLRDGGVPGISVDRYERVFQPEILGLPGYGWDQPIDTAAFSKAVQAIPAAQRRKTLEASLKDRRDAASPEASAAFLEALAKGNWLRELAHTALLDKIMLETKTGSSASGPACRRARVCPQDRARPERRRAQPRHQRYRHRHIAGWPPLRHRGLSRRLAGKCRGAQAAHAAVTRLAVRESALKLSACARRSRSRRAPAPARGHDRARRCSPRMSTASTGANTGTRLTKTPARPGPINSIARMKKSCDASEGADHDIDQDQPAGQRRPKRLAGGDLGREKRQRDPCRRPSPSR